MQMNNYYNRPQAVLYVLFFLSAKTWARALPTPPSPQTGLLSMQGRDIPTLLSTATPSNGPSWIRCGLTASVEVMDLDCVVLGYEPSLHKGSAEMLGVDSHIHKVRVDEKLDISHPAAKLYPCMFEHTSGLTRLRCEKVDFASRKVLDNLIFESLVAELLNGIPISIGPQISVMSGFDTSSYLVSIFLSGNSYDLCLIPAQNPTSLIESSPPHSTPARFESDTLANLSQQNTKRVYVRRNSTGKYPEPHFGFEFKKSLYCWFQENKYNTEIGLNCGVIAGAILDFHGMAATRNDLNAIQDRIERYLTFTVITPLVGLFQTAQPEDTRHRIPMIIAQTLMSHLSELLGNNVFGSTDFDWTPIVRRLLGTMNEQSSSVDTRYLSTTESLDELEQILLQYLNNQPESGGWSDNKITGSTNNEILGLFRRTVAQGHARRQLVRTGNPRVETGDVFLDASEGGVIPPPGTMVNHWFHCWYGLGSKVLCEIPGDHQAVEGTKNVKRVTSLGSLDSDRLPSITQPKGVAYLLADQPRLWNNCKFNIADGKHGMICPDTPHPEYADMTQIFDRIAGESLPSYVNPLAPKRHVPSPIPSTLSVGQAQLEQQTLTTSSNITPCKRPVFGRMGDTFAFTGFFAILAIFTITLYWMARNLFLALQDAFDAWTDRRKNKRLTPRRDLGSHGGLELPTLGYISNEHTFIGCNNGITAPVNAALIDVGFRTTSTGNQPTDEAGDTIKRKKAAIRVVIDEEQGVTTVEV